MLYKDVAIVRFCHMAADEKTLDRTRSAATQVLGENGFMYLFQKKYSEKIWRNMLCIQSNIKSMLGCGFLIHVNFYAPIDLEHPESPITYNFRDLGEDLNLIMYDEEKYCQKQAFKMAYYIQKLYHHDILRMKCEFAKDENNTIWFIHAKDIYSRTNTVAIADLQARQRLYREQQRSAL